MENFPVSAPVSLMRASAYDREAIFATLKAEGDALGIPKDAFVGKKVVIKPNLVAPTNPDGAATTHPTFLLAVVDFLRDRGASDLLLAESPGGPYNETALRLNYKVCGISDAAESASLPLNYSASFSTVHAADARVCRAFSVITPIQEADVIVDLCRLKSHSLTKMSAAVKNLFGVVPGIQKFEMHSAYPALPVFSEMLVDLAQMLVQTHKVLAICDAIVGMEGNGPTGGDPRSIGGILMSENPFSLDVVAEALIGFSHTVEMVRIAQERNLCRSLAQTEIRGVPPEELALTDFREPDATKKTFLGSLSTLFGGRLAEFFASHPKIDGSKCVGCGVCANSCPRHTIDIVQKKGKKKAVIRYDGCIRCFCCQELCPFHVIGIRQNPIIRWIH